MKVLTLNSKDFSLHCSSLADMVFAGGEQVDAIVGIANGGVFVAQEMAECMHVPVFSMKLQRATTKGKSSKLLWLLRRLPRLVNDLLRMAESQALLVMGRMKREKKLPVMLAVPTELSGLIAKKSNATLLVVDDAVDSGFTLLSVVESLKDKFPQVKIKTAVITVTSVDACVNVDYSLYGNRTLIRFPWSLDA